MSPIFLKFSLQINEHRKFFSDIHGSREAIAEKNSSIDLQVVPEWMYEAFVYVYKTVDESKNFSRKDIVLKSLNLPTIIIMAA